MARGNMRDEYYAIRRELGARLLNTRSRLAPVKLFEKWQKENTAALGRYDGVLREMKLRSEVDFATLSVAAQELRRLIAADQSGPG